jgi:tetratricopeptide (TPR) repeat protein
VALGTGCRGIGLKHLGRYAEAIPDLRAVLSQLAATGSFIVFPKYRSHLAEALWRSGQRDEARRELDQAFADQQGGEYLMHAELLRLRGDFQVDVEDWEAAELSYREALAVAASQKARLYELRAAVNFSRMLKTRSRAEEARQILTPVYGWFTEGFSMPDLRAAQALLAEL